MQKTMFPNVASQVAQLANLPRPEQFERILEIVQKIKENPGRGGGEPQARNVLRYFGLPEQLAEYSDRVRDMVAQIRQNLKPLTADQIMMGLEANVAWSNLQLKMKGFSDYIGATFAPVVTRAIDGISTEFNALESGATNWFAKLKADPSVARDWNDLSTRIGADLKSIVGSFSDFGGADTQLAVKNVIGGVDSVVKTLNSITTDRKLDWEKLFNLPVMQDQIAKLKDDAKAIESIYEKIPGYKALQETKGAPTEATPIPGLSGIGAWLKRLWAGSAVPPTAPTAPAEPLHDRPPPPSAPPPAPFVLPKLDQFPKTETAPAGPRMPRPMFSPIAFRPDEGIGAPVAGASSSRGDAIAIIAAGTRRGVADGMYDFYQTLKGMKDRAGMTGVTPASYETGGPGVGAGGLGGSLRGTGAGRAGEGAGGPAAAIGRAVRRQAHGGSGSGGGGPEATPGVPYTPGDITKTMGITPKQYQAFTSGVAQIEGGRYDKMGGAGGHFAGRYQFGRPEITETAKQLSEPNPTTQQFLHDPKMQERFMEAYSAEHYRQLMREPKFQALSQTQKLEMMGYAHNQGVGGALKYLRTGQAGRDAFGTSGTAYFDPIKKRLDALAKEPGGNQVAGPGRSLSGAAETSISSTLAKHGEALRKMFGERGPQKALRIDRPALPGQQDVSLRPGDLQRREPGALLRASSQMQAEAIKHSVTGEASLKIALASGLKPVGGVKSSGNLFKQIQLDRASPLPRANTTG